jgi:hypothetical protein
MERHADSFITADDQVEEFLREHGAESAWQTLSEVIQTCFPEVQQVRMWLLNDPDEDDRTWVMVQVLLPADHPAATLQDQRRQYAEMLVRRLPVEYHSLFGLSVGFAQGTHAVG